MKETRYFYLKLIFIFFSLFLLIIILYLSIITFERTFDYKTTLRLVSIYLLIPVLILIALFIGITVKEYKSRFYMKEYIVEGRSYLTIKDVFENENRVNVLKKILNNPGIHFNDLLRNCELQKGQLQWHLDVLLRYAIIKKKRYGQYSIFFPITSTIEEIDNFKNLLPKSKTTQEILLIVKNNPGINSSEISRIIKLSRNTIKYHIDKLADENLVKFIKEGRKIELYSINSDINDSQN